MTREEIAAMLNGRTIRNEVTHEDCLLLRDKGIVVVCGSSDDLMEFYGAITDEVGIYEGGTIFIDCGGVLPTWDEALEDGESGAAEYLRRKPLAKTIEALWCPDDNLSWAYDTDIPHSKFTVMEDGEPYCEGIVFKLVDLL